MRIAGLLLGLIFATGCSDAGQTGGEAPASPDQGPGLDGRCAPKQRLGGFEVGLDASFTTVTGQVKDSVLESVFLDDIATSEACRLVRRTNPFCDPTCSSPTICSVDMQCVPAPVAVSVGTVVISGLESAVEMSPAQPGSRYFFTNLPQPGMTPGRAIALTASGADVAGFTLQGEGVEPLDLPEGAWTLERGKPIELEWSPAPNADKTRVRVTLNIDQHGSTPVTMFCDFPDDGKALVPVELVEGLLDAGISGFPNGNVYRETSDRVQLAAGCVDFVVFAHSMHDLVTSGHVPCKTDAECEATDRICDLPSESCQ